MRRLTAILMMFILTLSLVSCGGQGEGDVYVDTTWHMDTYFSYLLYGRKAEKVFNELEEIVKNAEQVFDCYSADSEIYAVNEEDEDGYKEISRELFEVLERALSGYSRSDGAFDPTVGRLVSLWGFGTDDPSVPSDEDIKEALQHVGGSDVHLKQVDGRYYVSKPEGMMLDFGGIAKGYTLTLIARKLADSKLTDAVISVGGNVLLYGDRKFSVGIRRPSKDALDPVCTFSLSRCVVSTTGSYERFFVENGVQYCHIIDSKTGQSVNGDMVSLSVVMSDAAEADLWSTAYFVKGMDAALEAMRIGELEGVILTEDNRILCSEGLAEKLEEGSVAEGWTWEVVARES
ncbi:MAG: FAD:protein FMN transferase [Oscillospiraceae bacterium]|nr:FAD:protein FMN transferase [Oscillospiraceae bacterium]MBR0450909.1 FAD:protein FMN transferase [Oscillospiraceae bacterium]